MSIEKNTKNTLLHEENGFTTIINETICQIKHTGALGVYCYLASKPSGFIICKKHLQNHFECGREHIDTCFKYLKNIGLLEVTSVRDDEGRIIEWQTILRRKTQNTENPYCGDSPVDKSSKTHNTGFPQSGFQAPINKRININKRIINKTKQKTVPVLSSSVEVKTHILRAIGNKSIVLEDELQNQILFYIGNESDPKEINKKINIALKKIREGKWNQPYGYKGNDKTQAEEDRIRQEHKQKQYEQERISMNNIKHIISESGKNSLGALKKSLGSGKPVSVRELYA